MKIRGFAILGLVILSALPFGVVGSSGQQNEPTIPPPVPQWAWQTETVDQSGYVGLFASLALDENDRPHISYCSRTCEIIPCRCKALLYAHFDGTTWITETVDSTGAVGAHISLALDQADRPHISYCRWTCEPTCSCEDQLYATFDGTTWITATVDDSDHAGDYSSLVLDSTDQPHIGYTALSHNAIRYAYFDGTTWVTETVEEAGGAEDWVSVPSLALDTLDRPHFSYAWVFIPGSYLTYAYYDGSGWNYETIASWRGSVDSTSLQLDQDSLPHIVWSKWPEIYHSVLMYAHHDGQEWHLEQLTNEWWQGIRSYVSLALDPTGYPHIGYSQYRPADMLNYARYDGTTWITETVSWESAEYASLALDSSGQPHLSYFGKSPNYDLKYARTAACVPVVGVDILGPELLPVGLTSLYSASHTPPSATLPMRTFWNNGMAGPTAAYSWTMTGTYALAVTATNDCAQTQDVLSVTVFCQPVEAVVIDGPQELLISQTSLFQAAALPITASPPLSFTWDNGTVGPTANYSWTMTGTYSLTISATNVCGSIQPGFFLVQVLDKWVYKAFLPLVRHNNG